jgi:hypothetical protein
VFLIGSELQFGSFWWGGFAVVIAAATIGALFQRLTHGAVDADVPLFTAWLIVFIMIVPAAYRRGIRDATMHADDTPQSPNQTPKDRRD